MITCEVTYAFKNKKGEEVCGDTVRIKKSEEKTIVSVSDGLGSGVKANILSTLTASMATSMVFNGLPIEEVFESILLTLPVCKIRGISYATLATCLVEHTKKKCTIIEYEFPVLFYFRGKEIIELKKQKKIVKGKELYISKVDVKEGDSIFLMTDGISQAGMGTSMYPFGFGNENIEKELKKLINKNTSHKEITQYLISLAEELDKGSKGDDATVVALKIREKNILTIMVGPPAKKENDEFVVRKLINAKGKKVICGGTTGHIVERITGEKIEVDLNSVSTNSPPVGYMKGIDLVTEGIITLTQVFRYYEHQSMEMGFGAKRLIQLLEKADVINFFVGRAINPAHQNPLFTHDISLKFRLINDIAKILKKKDKIVNIEYF